MAQFRYTLDEKGLPIKYGYLEECGAIMQGSEPFTDFDIENYRKDLITNQWVKIEQEPDFPHENRNIRVELTDAQITGIVLNPQTRPLMEWAYHVPNRKTENGLVLWFIDFINGLMSEEETEALLISLGAVITRKIIQ
jgi:hypothetical protein